MIFDIVVFCILLISALISFIRGLVREVLTIVTLIGAGASAWIAAPSLKPYMLDMMDGGDGKRETFFNFIPVKLVADVCAYALVFVVVFIVLSLIGHLISKAVKGIGLGPADKALGVAFGLARGLALIVLVFILFTQMTEKGTQNQPDWMKNAYSLPLIEKSAAWVQQFLPEKKKEEIPAVDLPAPETKTEDKAQDESKTKTQAAPPAPSYDDKSREMLQNLIEQKETK